MSEQTIVMLILAVPPSVAIYLVYRMVNRMQEELRPLARALGGELKTSFFRRPYVRLPNYANEMRVRIASGSKNSPSKLVIEQMSSLGFTLEVSKENDATRLIARFGLVKDVKIGDPSIDDAYLIVSNDAARAQDLLRGQNCRKALEYFFSNGFTALVMDSNSLSAQKAGYRDKDLEPEPIRSHLERLQELAG